jgi:hypothetical protein
MVGLGSVLGSTNGLTPKHARIKHAINIRKIINAALPPPLPILSRFVIVINDLLCAWG